MFELPCCRHVQQCQSQICKELITAEHEAHHKVKDYKILGKWLSCLAVDMWTDINHGSAATDMQRGKNNQAWSTTGGKH